MLQQRRKEERREKVTKLKIPSTQRRHKVSQRQRTFQRRVIPPMACYTVQHPMYRLQSPKGTRGRIVATGGGTGRRA